VHTVAHEKGILEKAYKILLHGQCWPSNLHDFVKMDLYFLEGLKSVAPNAKMELWRHTSTNWRCGESVHQWYPGHYLRFRGRPQQIRDYE